MQLNPTVRQPAVAGMFYPKEEAVLANLIEDLLQNAKNTEAAPPKAIIVPHAGYIYSGPITATIYKTLIGQNNITRVVLLGPAHRVAFNGIAVTDMSYFATPLGIVAIDKENVELSTNVPNVFVYEHAYDMEHSLEVQLPFLQSILKDFKLTPCVVGNATPEAVADLLNKLWGGPETLIVISSDLSHYYDYETARKLDIATSNAIVELKPQNIMDNQACGRIPVKGLLLTSAEKHLQAKLLDLRNSGDTAGDKSRVVGYGAYYFK